MVVTEGETRTKSSRSRGEEGVDGQVDLMWGEGEKRRTYIPMATPSAPTLPLTSQGVTFCSTSPFASTPTATSFSFSPSTFTSGTLLVLGAGVTGANKPPTVDETADAAAFRADLRGESVDEGRGLVGLKGEEAGELRAEGVGVVDRWMAGR